MGKAGKTREKEKQEKHGRREVSSAFFFFSHRKQFLFALPISIEYICSVKNKGETARGNILLSKPPTHLFLNFPEIQ